MFIKTNSRYNRLVTFNRLTNISRLKVELVDYTTLHLSVLSLMFIGLTLTGSWRETCLYLDAIPRRGMPPHHCIYGV